MVRNSLIAIMILISASCQKSQNTTTAKIETTIGVEQPQTRVGIVPDEESEIWIAVWEQDDKIGGYTSGTTSIEEFSMVGTIEEYATIANFSGNASPESNMRFIYPYSSDLKPSSDGICYVNIERQTIDMDDSYGSLGEANMYMVSNEVYIDESGIAQDNITLQHLMSALELSFTIGNIDDNYIYKLIGIRITSTDTSSTYGFYTSGYLNLAAESPKFESGAIGVLLVEILNSPELSSGDEIIVPIMIAPTTITYKAYASVGATFSLHVSKTSRSSGAVTEDCCEYTKYLSKSQTLDFEAGAYNTVDCATPTFDFGSITDSWSKFWN